MNKTVKGTALITGGTRGIGRAITIKLAVSGYHVVATYLRDHTAAAEIVDLARGAGGSVAVLQADIRDVEQNRDLLVRIAEERRPVEVFVHSAASGVHRGVEQLTAKHLAWTLQGNVIGVHDLLAQLTPNMSSGGRVIGITSLGAARALPDYAAVGASKGALDALFRHYAWTLAKRGICVNLVCPGLVCTQGTDVLPNIDDRRKEALERTPTGRLTEPQDVAELVHFLCDRAAGQITGQTIIVDGGYTLR